MQPLRGGPERKALPRTKRLACPGAGRLSVVCFLLDLGSQSSRQAANEDAAPAPCWLWETRRAKPKPDFLQQDPSMFAKEGAFPWRGPKHATDLLF